MGPTSITFEQFAGSKKSLPKSPGVYIKHFEIKYDDLDRRYYICKYCKNPRKEYIDREEYCAKEHLRKYHKDKLKIIKVDRFVYD